MGTVSVRDLAHAAPADYGAAADNLQQIANSFEQAIVEFDERVVVAVRQSWQGDAADNAVTFLRNLADELTATEQYVTRFIGLLRAGQEGITDAQAYLTAAEELAQRNGYQVTENGSIIPLSANLPGHGTSPTEAHARDDGPPADAQGLLDKAIATAEAVSDSIAQALQDPEQFGIGPNWVADADTSLASARALEAVLSASPIELPAATMPADEVNLWWNALPAALQRQYIEDQPAAIGSLNGVPATARDQANRIVLQNDVDTYQSNINALKAQLAQYPSEPPAGSPYGIAYQTLQKQLNSDEQGLSAMKGIQSKLAMGGKSAVFNGQATTMPQMYLLGFNDNGIGHAEIACGDPDTAQNVCVYVPGMNTSAMSTHFQYDIQHTQNMTLQADADAGPGSTSTIMWLGYDSPQGIISAADSSNAKNAVGNLTNFINGLTVVNPNIANYTLLGHSYGSLVVGDTARSTTLPVNNIVLVGSPGVGVNTASDLNFPPSHIWVGAAPDDPVATSGWFGTPPTSSTFGANHFVVDATGDTGITDVTGQHGDYFDDSNSKDTNANANGDKNDSSLRNIGLIITGQTGKVTIAPSRPQSPILHQPV